MNLKKNFPSNNWRKWKFGTCCTTDHFEPSLWQKNIILFWTMTFFVLKSNPEHFIGSSDQWLGYSLVFEQRKLFVEKKDIFFQPKLADDFFFENIKCSENIFGQQQQQRKKISQLLIILIIHQINPFMDSSFNCCCFILIRITWCRKRR